MKIFRCLGKIIKRMDFFSVSQFLRYKQQREFRTMTGGICSFIIIVVFCVLFTSMGIQTLGRQIITATIDLENQIDPIPVDIVFGKDGGFMVAVSLVGFNLSDPTVTYFDINLRQAYYVPIYDEIEGWDIPLVMCTIQHFDFNPEIRNAFLAVNGTNMLCPPIGASFNIGGKITSQLFSRLQLTVSRCNSTLNSNCASDEQIYAIQSSAGSFTFAVPYINTLINPNSQDYETFFLEDRNYFQFTTTMASRVSAYMQSYEIDTDMSILPFEDKMVETGVNIAEMFQSFPSPVFQNQYINLSFAKSNIFTIYSRSFQKMDGFFSYIGGLIGTIMAALFVLTKYSQIIYELDLAKSLYLFCSTQISHYQRFNFLSFIGLKVKKIANRLGIFTQYCKRLQPYVQCHQEMEKQLDIKSILERLNFLDQTLVILMEKHQIETLHLQKKTSFSNAKKIRSNYQLAQLFEEEQECEGQHSKSNKNQDQNMKDNARQLRTIELNNGSELMSPNEVSKSSLSKETDKQKQLDRIVQQNMAKLRKQANEGNQVSKRILDQLNNNCLGKISENFITQENFPKVSPQKNSYERNIIVFDVEGDETEIRKSTARKNRFSNRNLNRVQNEFIYKEDQTASKALRLEDEKINPTRLS